MKEKGVFCEAREIGAVLKKKTIIFSVIKSSQMFTFRSLV